LLVYIIDNIEKLLYNIIEIYRKGENSIKSLINKSYNYFINNGEFFYEGQILRFYADCKYYMRDVKIEKFIKHYNKKTKQPFICVRIRELDGCKTHVMTYNAKNSLGKFFTSKNLDFFIFSIDKK